MGNPEFFIVGCPRSGTTLLERMVNAHPQVGVVHETHFITRFVKKRIGVDRDGFVTSDLNSRLLCEPRFARFGVAEVELERLIPAGKKLAYADLISTLFDCFGKREGKSIVGDKTTGTYLRNLPILHGLFPAARIFHLIRDGREIALSMLSWPKANRAAGRHPMWKTHPLATTALWWRWQVQRARTDGALIGSELYSEIIHDDLIHRPEETCAKICGLLGVAYDDRMLKFNEGRVSMEEAPFSANRAWLSPTPGLRNWREQMSSPDVELFEALTGDLLDELGFERAFPVVSSEVRSQAKEFNRQWYEASLRSVK